MADKEKTLEAIKSLKEIASTTPVLLELESSQLAIEALEKQIPKKVLSHDERNTGIKVCPNCKSIIDGWMPRHCQICGQKLDWSDE